MRILYLIPFLFIGVNFIFTEWLYSQEKIGQQKVILENDIIRISNELKTMKEENNKISERLKQSNMEKDAIKEKLDQESKMNGEKQIILQQKVQKLENLLIKNNSEADNDNNKDKTKKSFAQLNVVEQADLSDEYYDMSNTKEQTIVHLVPHTHLDPGWLMTFESYYQDKVKKILDSLMVALDINKARRFGWVEIIYLERWWRDANIEKREKFRKFHRRGQIEILMGGWVSSDEATTNYHEFINQMTEGHKFLQEILGHSVVPKTGWQIDPFGISMGVNTMFSQMCFDSNVFWRIGKEEYYKRIPERSIEFVWRSSDDLKNSSELFIHTLPWGYILPDNILFREGSNNVEVAARDFVDVILKRRTNYNSQKHIMIIYGHDFHFTDSLKTFDLLDKTMALMNENSKGRFFIKYSTPSQYINAIREEKVIVPRFEPGNDFLPYQAGVINWWTGYFTSRPNFKKACRVHDNMLRHSEFLFAFANINSKVKGKDRLYELLESSRRTNAIKTHHDAITGTSRETVLVDYEEMLSKSTINIEQLVQYSLNILANKPNVKIIELSDSSACTSFADMKNNVVVFNNLGWSRTTYLCFLSEDPKIRITNNKGKILSRQQIDTIINWKNGAISVSELYKITAIITLKPFEIKKYRFKHSVTKHFSIVHFPPSLEKHAKTTNGKIIHGKEVELKNDNIVAKFDKETGELREVLHKTGSLKKRRFSITHEFFVYDGDPTLDNHYSFKFLKLPEKIEPSTEYYNIHGFAVQSITRKISEEMFVTYKLFGDEDFLHIETVTGKMSANKNLVVRYRVKEIQNENKFWTDDNALQFIQRHYTNETRGLWAKFAPMVYGCIISDKRNQMSIITDTPEAVAVNEDSLEILIHRNSVQREGNGESMNDFKSANIHHLMRFDKTVPSKINTLTHRQLSLFHNYPLLVAKIKKSKLSFVTKTFPPFEFPPNIHLMTLQLYDNHQNVFGFRLLHQLQSSIEAPENKNFLADTSLDLDSIFGKRFHSLEERTLTFNSKFDHCYKENWDYDQNNLERRGAKLTKHHTNKNITVSPLEIKSYFLRFK